MTLGFQAQGDILIIPVARERAKGEPIERRDGRLILAEGEATGHHHSIVDKYATAYRFRPDDAMTVGGDGAQHAVADVDRAAGDRQGKRAARASGA